VRDRSELEALRTRVANQAASLAETVNEGFEDFHMGAGDYVVELGVPDGPSTGGGVQALQHLRLVPRRKGYAVVVAGSVNPVLGTAELRTFDHVAMLHEARFRRPLEITAEEWSDFLAKAGVVMNLLRLRTTLAGPPPDLVARTRSRVSQRISTPMLVVFLLVMALVGVVVFLVARTVYH
jgi:hypothetical protein